MGVTDMSELLQMLLVLPAGMLIGGVFFGGLWWTVQKGVTARQPALWFGVSLLLRTGITLAGFYLGRRGGLETPAAVPVRIHHHAPDRDQVDGNTDGRGGRPCTLVPTN